MSEVTLEDHDFSVFDYNRLFLSKSKNILLIPYGFKALLFHISRNFIEFKGIISHTITSDVHEYVGFMESFIIEEMLYTKSRCEIQIHRIYNTKYIGSLYTPGCIKTWYHQPLLLIHYHSYLLSINWNTILTCSFLHIIKCIISPGTSISVKNCSIFYIGWLNEYKNV